MAVTEEEPTNLLMQVEGSGETYMVMWEAGSNIQDLLTYAADDVHHQHHVGAINPPPTELENLFQMAAQ